MKLTSPDFQYKGMIPKEFTCDGKDINPELHIEDIPEGTMSLVLIVDDPDAPGKTFVHWVVYDIAPDTTTIEKDSVPGKQGVNDFGKEAYGGPCPPSGKHRYFFKLYALDKELGLEEGKSKNEIEHIIDGHIIEKVELVGLYER